MHKEKAMSSRDSNLDSDCITQKHSKLLIYQNIMGKWRKFIVHQKQSLNKMKLEDPCRRTQLRKNSIGFLQAHLKEGTCQKSQR